MTQAVLCLLSCLLIQGPWKLQATEVQILFTTLREVKSQKVESLVSPFKPPEITQCGLVGKPICFLVWGPK